MKLRNSTVLSAVGSMLITTGAMAADLPPTVVAAAPPPPPMAAPSFDWSGTYVGAGGFYLGIFGASAQLGYNIDRGRMVFGVEGHVYYAFGSPWPWAIGADARVGFKAGERALLFAVAGVNYGLGNPPGSPLFWEAGGGAEFAVGDRMSIYAEGLALGGFPGCCGFMVKAGLNFHPGN